jgi:hypothetical protein
MDHDGERFFPTERRAENVIQTASAVVDIGEREISA